MVSPEITPFGLSALVLLFYRLNANHSSRSGVGHPFTLAKNARRDPNCTDCFEVGHFLFALIVRWLSRFVDSVQKLVVGGPALRVVHKKIKREK